jgi:hypothetical protein
MSQAFLNKFRADIDLFHAEVAEKKTLRSTMLEQLGAEWDAQGMQLLSALSPSSFLRGNTLMAEVHAFPPGSAQTSTGFDPSEPETPRVAPHRKPSVSSTAEGLAACDIASQMSIARSLIAWLYAALCRLQDLDVVTEDWADRIFITSLLPHQAHKVSSSASPIHKKIHKAGTLTSLMGRWRRYSLHVVPAATVRRLMFRPTPWWWPTCW